MSIRIRAFTPHDYEAIVRVENAVYPDYPATVETWRFEDERREPGRHLERWLAEAEGTVVGFATAQHSDWMFHPRRFWIGVSVLPEQQGQRIGAALYDHLLESLGVFRPEGLIATCREDMPRAVRFLQDRGFQETMREWESRLDVPAFDPTPFAEAEERVRAQGIEIRTLAELRAEPDWQQKLHALNCDLEADVPRSEPEFTPPAFEHFIERLRDNPTLLPEAYFVAVQDGEYLGTTQLFFNGAGPDLDTGLTGVRRAHRRKGIALALKLRAIGYARERGHPVIKTWNATQNRPMLSINEALGFARQPAWIEFTKEMGEADTGT